MKFPNILGLLALIPILSNCSVPHTPNPDQKTIKQAGFVNPYKAGTYDYFVSDPAYPNTSKVWKDDVLVARANTSNTSMRIDLSLQRGFLLVGDQIAMDYKVSTGNSTHRTPTGNFTIIEKKQDKRSNLYGTIYDSAGNVAKHGADTREDSVPEGGKYVGAPMSYWMRLTNAGVGMHKGNVGSRYASHGCIRSYPTAVPVVYSKVKLGTPVAVVP